MAVKERIARILYIVLGVCLAICVVGYDDLIRTLGSIVVGFLWGWVLLPKAIEGGKWLLTRD